MKENIGLKILGSDYVLEERNAKDVLDLNDFADLRYRQKLFTDRVASFVAATCISQALENNWQKLFWLNPKRWLLRRKLRARYLMKKLSQKELVEISQKVLELDGLLDKKKEPARREERTDELLKTSLVQN